MNSKLTAALAASLCCWLGALAFGADAEASGLLYQGFSMHPMWGQVSTPQMDAELDAALAAHASVVRFDVSWSAIETVGPGEYNTPDLAKLDQFVTDAALRKIAVLPVVFSTPCWASSAPDSLKQSCTGDWWNRGVTSYPPTNAQDYANFIAWMLRRYGSQLAAIELWNEPNAPGHELWTSTNPAADYATLVRATYPAAKAADASVPVLAGSISGADAPFLQALYDAGLKGYYDGLAIHPYNGNLAPTAACPSSSDTRWCTLAGLNDVRAVRAAAGDDKPMWVTEFGWSTAAGGVSTAQQMQYIPQMLELFRAMPDVSAAVVYQLRGMTGDAFDDGFAMLDQSFAPKPAYVTAAADLLTH